MFSVFSDIAASSPSSRGGAAESGRQLRRDGQVHSIIPGMVASVDIMTGEKTVLQYLMKPITKARNEALRER